MAVGAHVSALDCELVVVAQDGPWGVPGPAQATPAPTPSPTATSPAAAKLRVNTTDAISRTPKFLRPGLLN